MRSLFKLLIPLSLVTVGGCVVAPYGYPAGYLYGPRVAIVGPAAVGPPPWVVVHPYR